MGFRLRRRIRIAPGISLNVSKSGLSTSFGPRGAHITLGHGHVRNTVGIPGTGMYWTSVSGSGRRQTRQVTRRPVRRAPPPAYRPAPTAEQNRQTAKGCLVVVGVVVGVALAVASYGLALIPIALGLVLYFVLRRRHRNHQPWYLAQQLIKQAMAAPDPAATVGLLHEAIDTDPGGKTTLLESANWFYDRHCWADAADAYAGYLHIESTPYYELRHVQALMGAGHLDDAASELAHLRTEALDESDQALVLSQLALTFVLKRDPSQGLAFANEASLKKHALSAGAQKCLMMRGTCRYLVGQKAKGIEDLERLYALNSLPEVLEAKTKMQAGTFQVDVPRAYPDWYPAKVELREGPVVEEVHDGHDEALAAGTLSPDRAWIWSGTEWTAVVPTSAQVQSPPVEPVPIESPPPPAPPTVESLEDPTATEPHP